MNSTGILIVTDDAPSSRAAALAITTEFFGDISLNVVSAAAFTATDILGVRLCFFGCACPSPNGFEHFVKVLRHINLPLRHCALFSMESAEATDYLAGIVRDCDIKLSSPPLVSSSLIDVKKWARRIASSI